MPDADRTYTVVISDKASAMLVSHARFLAEVNKTAAIRLIEEFEKCARSLEGIPERCSWLDDPMVPARRYRKIILKKRYLLVFRIKENTVYIDAVVDCRQDYGWLL